MSNEKRDPVAHYMRGGLECIDAMKAIATREEFRGYLKLTAFKYLWRIGQKDLPEREAKKALDYVKWLHAELAEDARSAELLAALDKWDESAPKLKKAEPPKTDLEPVGDTETYCYDVEVSELNCPCPCPENDHVACAECCPYAEYGDVYPYPPSYKDVGEPAVADAIGDTAVTEFDPSKLGVRFQGVDVKGFVSGGNIVVERAAVEVRAEYIGKVKGTDSCPHGVAVGQGCTTCLGGWAKREA